MRSRGAVPRPRREAGDDDPARDRASPHGHFFACYGGLDGRPGAPRSGGRAVRSGEPRALATRFGHNSRVSALSFRSVILWLSGFPDAALADTRDALSQASEIGQPANVMLALVYAGLANIHCGDYAEAEVRLQELV